MKKLYLIILFLHSVFFADDVLVKLKGGNLFQGDYLGVYNQSIYCRTVIFNEVKIIPCSDILEIRDSKNNVIEIDCNNNTFDPSTIKTKSSIYLIESDTSVSVTQSSTDLAVIGTVMLVVSGVMGLVNTNRECNDCSMEDWEDFGDSMKLISNIQYSTLIIGGILMAVDHSNKKIVQQE